MKSANTQAIGVCRVGAPPAVLFTFSPESVVRSPSPQRGPQSRVLPSPFRRFRRCAVPDPRRLERAREHRTRLRGAFERLDLNDWIDTAGDRCYTKRGQRIQVLMLSNC
jgi:hypothetical protein